MRRIHISAERFTDMVEEKCLFVIGGYENMMSDSIEGDEDYEYAKNIINDLDAIIDEAFDELENDLRASISANIRAKIREVVTPRVKAILSRD